ncbi:MAG: hypothetical protein AUK63_1573 [bacterium P3]|nr:MAG: hypothetical protein AUK63_1573 [bacterium P3]KWW40933.1 MAG: hypothetical protein F083_1277 [bacterium F083]
MNPEPFWAWFQSHAESLTMIGDLDDRCRAGLLDELQRQLTAYCDGLTCEVSDPGPNGRTLTVSAEGDIELFRAVVALVEAAPDLDWWDIVAFRQPQGTALTVRFDRLRFATARMWFQQLECADRPDLIGLRVTLPADLPPDAASDDVEVGVYVTLEALIGEVDCATLLGYVETCPLPAEPLKSGFQPLDDLPALVAWWKEK